MPPPSFFARRCSLAVFVTILGSFLSHPFFAPASVTAFAPKANRVSTRFVGGGRLTFVPDAVTATGDDALLEILDNESPTVTSPSSTIIPTGLEPWQEDELEALLDDALIRMAFIMETNALEQVEHSAVAKMFRTCQEIVKIQDSTIPGAGRGLFATQDIPKGTIVALYPIHCLGCRFESGSCLSVQVAQSPEDMIDVESSAYALYCLLERPLLGIDLNERFPRQPRLFVDMNPKATLHKGWYCGLINDAAMVRFLGDTEYYETSRGSLRNVEIVPFGPVAPFQVGVTTRDVAKGEELFVSYGYKYWANLLRLRNNTNNDEELVEEWRVAKIQEQEDTVALDLANALQLVHENYRDAALELAELFDSLGPAPLPVTSTSENASGAWSKSRKREIIKNVIKVAWGAVSKTILPKLARFRPKRRMSRRLGR